MDTVKNKFNKEVKNKEGKGSNQGPSKVARGSKQLGMTNMVNVHDLEINPHSKLGSKKKKYFPSSDGAMMA